MKILSKFSLPSSEALKMGKAQRDHKNQLLLTNSQYSIVHKEYHILFKGTYQNNAAYRTAPASPRLLDIEQ